MIARNRTWLSLGITGSLIALLALEGCGSSADEAPDTLVSPAQRYGSAGPYAVGNTTVVLTDTSRSRTLTVEVWYPAADAARTAAAQGVGTEQFFPAGTLRDQYANLLAAAPADGPTRIVHSARDAEPAGSRSPWPLLLFSHCHECVRFSAFEIAERLASHGIAVAAPDHTGNTLFDRGARLNTKFLKTRAADIRFVADALLGQVQDAGEIPARLTGRFDANRLGVFGHSFGGLTTGLVLQDDHRFRAGFSIAAPPENPLVPGVLMADIHQPLALLVAREDNSILEVGNEIIRDNFSRANPPVWKIEVTDAGHWSFSDICGLTPGFAAGCGPGVRQTVPGEPFTYLAVTSAIPIAQRYVTAFFAAELLADESALSVLSEAIPKEFVSTETRTSEKSLQ